MEVHKVLLGYLKPAGLPMLLPSCNQLCHGGDIARSNCSLSIIQLRTETMAAPRIPVTNIFLPMCFASKATRRLLL